MKKAFLISDMGYEHNEVLAAIIAPSYTDMEKLKTEFEDLIGCHPSNELKYYKQGSQALAEHIEFLANLKAKLIHANLLEDYGDEYYRDKCFMSDFLLGFANWLEREKGFILMPVDQIGYVNCGLKP